MNASRRRVVAALLAAASPRTLYADPAAAAALRAGGVVVAFRHALAPGTFDPPGFRLDDCTTQRNLNDEGRAQSRRIGAWFEHERLVPARVLSSPWCRCLDTARLAFGRADVWQALGSPRSAGREAADEAARVAELRAAVAAARARRGFDVWVSHQFLLQSLTGSGVASGEGLVLRTDGETVTIVARLNVG